MFIQSLIVGAFALSAHAQSSSSSNPFPMVTSTDSSTVAAETTMNLFLGNNEANDYVGWVIGADACGTSYSIACTQGSYSLGPGLSGSCDPDAPARVTYGGSTSFEISTQTTIMGAVATFVQTCLLTGSTEAACSASIYASAQGSSTKTTTTTTLTGNELDFHQVPITAGAALLDSTFAAAGTCTTSGNAAAPTGILEVYKVLVVPGAAALLGALA